MTTSCDQCNATRAQIFKLNQELDYAKQNARAHADMAEALKISLDDLQRFAPEVEQSQKILQDIATLVFPGGQDIVHTDSHIVNLIRRMLEVRV